MFGQSRTGLRWKDGRKKQSVSAHEPFSELKMPYGKVVTADFTDLESGALAARKQYVILLIDMP